MNLPPEILRRYSILPTTHSPVRFTCYFSENARDCDPSINYGQIIAIVFFEQTVIFQIL